MLSSIEDELPRLLALNLLLCSGTHSQKHMHSHKILLLFYWRNILLNTKLTKARPFNLATSWSPLYFFFFFFFYDGLLPAVWEKYPRRLTIPEIPDICLFSFFYASFCCFCSHLGGFRTIAILSAWASPIFVAPRHFSFYDILWYFITFPETTWGNCVYSRM